VISTPDVLEQAAIELLDEKLVWHAAAFERLRGLPPRTIQLPKTIDLLADADHPLARDVLPAVLLSITQTQDQLEVSRNGYAGDVVSVPWRLEIEIAALGGGLVPQNDAMLRVRWLALLTAECLWRRYRLLEVVESCELLEAQFEVVVDTGGALGHASLAFAVASPTFGTEAIGPETGDPYDPPAYWPYLTPQPADVIRVPITEPI
jgi:hypothetical protein